MGPAEVPVLRPGYCSPCHFKGGNSTQINEVNFSHTVIRIENGDSDCVQNLYGNANASL